MTDTHNTKVCSKCREEKTLDCFAKASGKKDGLQTKCKSCDKAYRDANKEKIRSYLVNYHADNRDLLLDKKRKYRLDNIDKIRQRDRDWRNNNIEKCRLNSQKQWKNNKEKYSAANTKRDAYRRKTDHLYNMRKRVSHRVRMALKGVGLTKSTSTMQMIGCTFDELKSHLENQFVDGMCWERRSEIHIDHIIPLATAKTEEDMIRLCHYTNLQPLWAADNLRKSDKLEYQP